MSDVKLLVTKIKPRSDVALSWFVKAKLLCSLEIYLYSGQPTRLSCLP